MYFKKIFSCLGLSCEEITHACLPESVQRYACIMMKQYKKQPIVAADWPPRVGHDFFGRLALVERENFVGKKDHEMSSWHLLRGEVDEIPKLPGHTEIEIENILQPNSDDSSGVVVIDGPPGIGKTTLCRKILQMWSNGTLVGQFSQYDLVLYCPLRSRQIADGSELADLLDYECPKVNEGVSKWMETSDGKGLLIIFDGWDELSTQLRQNSLPAKIIRKKRLSECSIIVTSRSYASASLLEMNSKYRHIQVIGFSRKEINTVIIKTLQSDQALAQDLIDRVNGLQHEDAFLDETDQSTESRSKSQQQSELAAKLINSLKMRSDVQSLCYVPLVCSMVILVYCKNRDLPATLTELYENFVLQTIRRHVKRYYDDSINGIFKNTIDNLSELPPQLVTPFKELCELSYISLVNSTMTFTSGELQKWHEAVKEKYLGLMTTCTFRESDDEKHQFLHLSIQEFLAAWWMTHYEKRTEELFREKFDNHHFRMCLRFVAGLTRLENESYWQYFNRKFDLSSKRKHFALERTLFSHFYHESPSIRSERMVYDCIQSVDTDNLTILLLQLMYESQNIKLCELLAKSMNYDMCLYEVGSSLFDVMCILHFFCNSNAMWKQVTMGYLYGFIFSGFDKGLRKMFTVKCTELGLLTNYITNESMESIADVISQYNVQSLFLVLHGGEFVSSFVLLQILAKIPQLKILHFSICYPDADESIDSDCPTVEKCIKENSTLKELKIAYHGGCFDVSSTINSIIRGVARNKTLRSFTLEVDNLSISIQGTTIEQLVRENMILKALSLNIPDSCLSLPLNISAVNTPLTALEIGRHNTELMTAIVPHVKGLNCLSLPYPDKIYQLPESLPYTNMPQLLFHSHPNLQQLTLPLNETETATELCTILQTNTTLQGLKMEIEDELVFTEGMNISLKDMLKRNKTLQFLEIITPSCISSNVPDFPVPISFLSHVTAGLRRNTSLKQLGLPITLPVNEQVKTFFDVITQKGNLTDIQVYYLADQSCSNCSVEEKKAIMTPLFYEQGLPVISGMLKAHATIKLRVECEYLDKSVQPNWEEPTVNFCESVYLHPSLEYLEIIGFHSSYKNKSMLENYLEERKGDLAKRRRQEEPLKLMPKVNFARKYLYLYNY